MRLICPNCDAQYEVDAKVIPENGRDVQCSNCGHSWFQPPAALDAEDDFIGLDLASEAPAQDPFAQSEDEHWGDESDETTDDVEELEVARSEGEDEDENETEDLPPPPAGDHAPRSALTDEVRDILREEREFSERPAPEPEPFETQTDLGLDNAPMSSSRALKEKMARLRGLDPKDPALGSDEDDSTGKRRGLLPDIEEINSTLNAQSEDVANASPDEIEQIEAEKKGFRTGFALFIIIASLLIGLYVTAPAIADAVPALSPILESYVSGSNAFRGWLDAGMMTVSDRLGSLLNSLSSSA